MEKIHPDLKDSVAETLLIPLAMRALDVRQKRPVLGDAYSARLMEQIDYPFGKFISGSLMSRVGTNVRAKYFDQCAKDFIDTHARPVVVALGCGLDTRRERLRNSGKAMFYEVDLPEVIHLRTRLVPEAENSRCIARSFLDRGWVRDVREAHPDGDFLIIIEGVLMYFEEVIVRDLLRLVADSFPGAEMCLDVMSVWISRQSGRHDTVRKMRAGFRWGIDDDRELEAWHPGVRVVSDESIMRLMGEYHWFPRLLRHIPVFRDCSRMLRVRVA